MTPGSDAEKNYIINELDKIEQKMLKLFSSAYVDAIGLGEVRTAIKNCTEQFAFDNFPAAKTKLKTILSTLKESTQKTVIESQKNVANVALKTSAQGLMKNFEHKKKDLDLVENISEKSIDQAREASSESANGFKLSSNVWDLDKYATKEIEAIVQAGIRQGKTVEDIARSVTPYLKNPGLENAEPEFQKIKTPQGVFASAYRNALRMARTEVVRAYDEAEWNSYQNDPLIVGFEVRLSNNHTVKIRGKKKPLKDICDQLQGKYPKTFKFTGWHPQCRCTMIPIPIGADELGAFADAEDNGTEFKSKNAVDELPENFKNWVEENSDRIDGAVSLPYFISENQAVVDSLLHPTKDIPFEEWAKPLREAGAGILDFRQDKSSPITAEYAKQMDFARLIIGVKEAVKTKGLDVSYSDISVLLTTIDGEDAIALSFNFGDPREGFKLSRNFFKKYGIITVEHSLFQIPKESQGNGLSKELLGLFYDEYKKADIDRIEVHANIDVGGYTWGRYGFKQKTLSFNNNVKESVEKTIVYRDKAKHTKEAKSVVDEFYSNHDASTPFPMNLFYEKLGRDMAKEILLGSSWYGFIDLHDKEQTEIFESYLYSKKKKT